MTHAALALPLATDANGVVRVGGTRVTLDTVAAAFGAGLTAESVAEQYPSLALADVYAVFSYLLSQPAEVEGYLGRRQAEAGSIRTENEARFAPHGLRARLLARRGRG